MINCEECPFKERIVKLEDKVDKLTEVNAEIPYMREKIDSIQKTVNSVLDKLDKALNLDAQNTVNSVRAIKGYIVAGLIGCIFTVVSTYVLSIIVHSIK